jgi:hypothetical protein
VNTEDENALAAIRQAMEHDALVREQIKQAMECYDRANVERIVERVVKKLNLSTDIKQLADAAYHWLKSQHWF